MSPHSPHIPECAPSRQTYRSVAGIRYQPISSVPARLHQSSSVMPFIAFYLDIAGCNVYGLSIIVQGWNPISKLSLMHRRIF